MVVARTKTSGKLSEPAWDNKYYLQLKDLFIIMSVGLDISLSQLNQALNCTRYMHDMYRLSLSVLKSQGQP